MAEPLIVVDSDYTVYLQGRKFALSTQPRLVRHDDPFSYMPKIRVSFECVELPEMSTPPEPTKRTWASAMGLRKPRKESK
ncbi:hypothetical protein SEA_LADYBIRD_41 [Mycobacterium phage LadyBird]|uniref:hypothetical protein n=1 Tax=Mycobacterium phage LadyBird TaxID=1718166 RepID=UPI0006CE2C34|nr:hypothetical protein SEA_LADYBIRD_41 [Mycobacterium phage LadyBird]ALF02182.1 hypothetical protein SEA_LADYBIRD_41 [Mycobacterium phage LadyBird]